MFLVNLLRSDCFDNLDRVRNVVDYLFLLVLHQFFLHICIVILVMFHILHGKFSTFVVFQLLFFGLVIQVVYFY